MAPHELSRTDKGGGMDDKAMEALAVDQRFFAKAHQRDGVSIRISGSTYSVRIPYYDEPVENRPYLNLYIPESTIEKLRVGVRAIQNDRLWQNPALRQVLQKHSIALDSFLQESRELWRRPPRAVKGENCHVYYDMVPERKGMLNVGYFLAEVAHVLRTSKEPLSEERKFWEPYLADMVAVKPGRVQNALSALASLFTSISMPGAGESAREKLPATGRISSYHPEDVEQAIVDAFIRLVDDDDLSELELRAISRGENPPKVLDAALANLDRASLVTKSRVAEFRCAPA